MMVDISPRSSIIWKISQGVIRTTHRTRPWPSRGWDQCAVPLVLDRTLVKWRVLKLVGLMVTLPTSNWDVLNWGILASKLHHLSTGNHWVILGQNKSCSAWKTCCFKPTSNGFSRETCNFYTWEPSHCDITTDIYWHGIAVRLLE